MFTVRGVPYHFTIRAGTNGGYGETKEIIFFSQELGKKQMFNVLSSHFKSEIYNI